MYVVVDSHRAPATPAVLSVWPVTLVDEAASTIARSVTRNVRLFDVPIPLQGARYIRNQIRKRVYRC